MPHVARGRCTQFRRVNSNEEHEMKRSLLAVLALSGALLLSPSSAAAQNSAAPAASAQDSQVISDQDITMLRKDIRSQKKQVIAANISLTDTEAQQFWPIYDQYTAELVQINNDKYALIKEYAQSYGSMTDAQAEDWAQRLLKLDANVAGLRLKYWPIFRRVLPAKKAALYIQVERRAQMLIDVQLSSQIPLLQP
jgi:Spy/CpxP family protein refolding chaperone